MANNDEDRYVVKHDDGWAVKKNAKRASNVYPTQAEAISRARQIVTKPAAVWARCGSREQARDVTVGDRGSRTGLSRPGARSSPERSQGGTSDRSGYRALRWRRQQFGPVRDPAMRLSVRTRPDACAST